MVREGDIMVREGDIMVRERDISSITAVSSPWKYLNEKNLFE